MKTIDEYPWGVADIPWTIVGKGPSLQALLDCSPPGLRMGINDSCSSIHVNIVIITGLLALDLLAPHILHFQSLFVPHALVDTNKGTDPTVRIGIGDIEHDVLQHCDSRTYVYPWNNGPGSITAWNNTSEAAFEIVCRYAPCRQIITAGIDGGTEYHGAFAGTTTNIDHQKQFDTMVRLARQHGMKWLRWGQPVPA